MRRFRPLALAISLVLAGVAACDLNPQPLPPIGPNDNGETTGPSGSRDAGLPPMADAGTSIDGGGGVPGDDAGDAGSDASDADADMDAGDDAGDGGVTDGDDAG